MIGGFAVNVRITHIHRLTNDIDMVSRDQAKFVELLVAEATAPIATSSSLIALKAVAIARRPHGRTPEKIGSDIHDLVRLVHGCDFDIVASAIAGGGSELSGWVKATSMKHFSPDRDLRYTFARVRRLARSVDAEALTEDDLAVVADLSRALPS